MRKNLEQIITDFLNGVEKFKFFKTKKNICLEVGDEKLYITEDEFYDEIVDLYNKTYSLTRSERGSFDEMFDEILSDYYNKSFEEFKELKAEALEIMVKDNIYLDLVVNGKIRRDKTIKENCNEYDNLITEGIAPILYSSEGTRHTDSIIAVKENSMEGNVYTMIAGKTSNSINIDAILKHFSFKKLSDIKKSITFLYENPYKFINVRIGPFVAEEILKKVKDDEGNFKEMKVYSWRNFIKESNKAEGYFTIREILKYTIDSYIKNEEEKSIPTPKIFTNDPSEPCFAFFNKDKIVDGDFPTIRSFLTHFDKEDEEVFNAFTYSIFEAKNNGRQMLVLHDDGFSGKSVFIKALANTLGKNISTSINNVDIKRDFFYSKIYGSRFISMADNNNSKITMTEAVKNITGGDMCTIEYKNQGGFLGSVYGKMIMGSNHKLQPENETHQRSRLLILNLRKYDESILKTMCELDKDGNVVRDEDGNENFIGNAGYEDRFNAEFPAYLKYCEHFYNKLCTSHGNVIASANCKKNFKNACGLNDNEIYKEDLLKVFKKVDGVNTPSVIVKDIIKEYAKQKQIKEIQLDIILKAFDVELGNGSNTKITKKYYKNLTTNNRNRIKGIVIDFKELVIEFPNNHKINEIISKYKACEDYSRDIKEDKSTEEALEKLHGISNMGSNKENVDKYINSNKSVFNKVEVEVEKTTLEDLNEEL